MAARLLEVYYDTDVRDLLPAVRARTAETHVENIRRKLQVNSRAQIAAWVTRHQLHS